MWDHGCDPPGFRGGAASEEFRVCPRRGSASRAALLIAQNASAKFLGGGTNLIDLMRENIEQPDALVDITRLPLAAMEELPDGGLRIGALVRNSHLAAIISWFGNGIRCSRRPF